MIRIALVAGVAALLLVGGFEMFLVLGAAGLGAKLAFFPNIVDTAVVQKMVGAINHQTLLAIPFFILAAELMGDGQIARRLTGAMRAFLGHLPGGMGYTAIGGAMAFGSVSGSAPATVAALGNLVYPEMRKEGFSEKFSLGLIASSAETALLIPPSITIIIYAWMTGTSVVDLFMAGLAIGIVLGLAFAAYTWWVARGLKADAKPRANWAERGRAIRAASWALGMPVIIMGGIYSGFLTPTDAAAVSVVYAILVETVIYRSMGFQKLMAVTQRAAVSTAIIFILLAVGGILSYIITLARLPDMLLMFLNDIGANWVVFLMMLNVVFLIAGMFIDPNSALIILVPSLYPVAVSLGIDPVHFGMIATLNITIGMITPPFGLDLFVASSTLRKPVLTIIRGIWPFVGVNLVVLALVTYVPSLSTFLPMLLK